MINKNTQKVHYVCAMAGSAEKPLGHEIKMMPDMLMAKNIPMTKCFIYRYLLCH